MIRLPLMDISSKEKEISVFLEALQNNKFSDGQSYQDSWNEIKCFEGS